MAAISIHRYVNGRFWPHLPESNFDRSGECQGKGYNVNIALSGRGLGDADCLAIFQQIILPVGRRLWSIRKAIQVPRGTNAGVAGCLWTLDAHVVCSCSRKTGRHSRGWLMFGVVSRKRLLHPGEAAGPTLPHSTQPWCATSQCGG
ncbi:hypothetical protein RvY_06309-2 [Ramazzottius varieornatus]|uniref:Histone deacetylase domain-containing protein n=1 Tax=Ramazzottius varieornatus TaxID=947166 RepID=A0A1D1V7S4_RAMVA|nr:hypothetical protein RvY_06309-2 [Ramazzottius varieornatus]